MKILVNSNPMVIISSQAVGLFMPKPKVKQAVASELQQEPIMLQAEPKFFSSQWDHLDQGS